MSRAVVAVPSCVATELNLEPQPWTLVDFCTDLVGAHSIKRHYQKFFYDSCGYFRIIDYK